MRHLLIWVAALAVAVGCAGCARLESQPADDIPSWKIDASAEVITAAPDAGGPLSFRNCPTLDEARAAVPVLVGGPDANAVPFKTMVLQCGYSIERARRQGRPAGIWILVFDASVEGAHLWDSVRTDPAFPNATEIPALADVAFATGTSGHNDVWVVEGSYGFHMYHTQAGR